MRILCLTARLPFPPDRGDRLRAYHFLERLSRQHEIHLLSFISSDSERENIPPLMNLCHDVKVVKQSLVKSIIEVSRNLQRQYPLQALYYRSREMSGLVNMKLSSLPFDAAYVHLFRMAQYVEEIENIYRIVDLTDVISNEIMLSLPYRNLLSLMVYAYELPRIKDYERTIAQKVEEVWLISESDRNILKILCPTANLHVVTNGVDTDHFFPTGQSPHPNTIIFTGHFGVPHNIDAAVLLARQVLPLIQQVIPESSLILAGSTPSTAVLKLQTLPGVSVTGYISDLNATLNQAAVFAAPLRFASGTQNKVLEAMATARPVVTTTCVNTGLGAVPGKELLIADTFEDMAYSIIRLLQQPELAQDLGKAAHDFVVAKYSWEHVCSRVNQIRVDR